MRETKPFSLGALLSVTQERMLAPDGPGEVYGLITHVLFGPLEPGQQILVTMDALEPCAAELKRQLSWLDQVPTLKHGTEDLAHTCAYAWAWLDTQEQKWGPEHLVTTRRREE